MTTRPYPTLRAVGPDEEPEGFPLVEVHVDDQWTIETVGMRASDIGDTVTSERLARVFAAAPDLLAALEEAYAIPQRAECAAPPCTCIGFEATRVAIKKARGGM